jgi:hypothetical protein
MIPPPVNRKVSVVAQMKDATVNVCGVTRLYFVYSRRTYNNDIPFLFGSHCTSRRKVNDRLMETPL